MGKYLFFDIDGTLVGQSKMMTQKNKDALILARKNGHKTFLCTGRSPTSIVKNILEVGYDGIVCSAGGFVIIDGHYIFENYIDVSLLKKVMKLFYDHQVLFTLETKDAIYETDGVKEFFDMRHQNSFGSNLELMRFFELRRQGENRLSIEHYDDNIGVTKLCFVAKNKNNFFECVDKLEKYFNVVVFSKDEEEYINGEIIIKDCTKADGIVKAVNYFQGNLNDTIGFGDSMNDYEMIDRCAVGVVYKGADDKLKEKADYFFDDPDKDGIYKILKELRII